MGLTNACLPVVVQGGVSGTFHANTFAVFRVVSEWNWYKLPKSYLESPYLSADDEALKAHSEEARIVGAQSEECSPAFNLDEEEREDCNNNCQQSERSRKS